MISPAAAWTFTARHPLVQWYGHVQLLPDRVLGQWVCVERSAGKPLWEKRYHRPNTVVGVSEGVIIASEMRSDGPWTLDFGCYAISLETGDLLWVSHGSGLWGRVLRCLDYLPGFTNDLRDSPMSVEGPECICGSGRVLDVRTGQQIRQLTQEQLKSRNEAQKKERPKSDAQVLYEGGKVPVSSGAWLTHTEEPGVMNARGLRLRLLNEDDTIRWSFDLDTTGYQISHCNFYAYRYARPYVYIVASEEPSMKPHPTLEHHVLENPTLFRLLTLDTSSGELVQDIPLGSQRYSECRIEDIDEHGLLVAADHRSLWYFTRTATWKASARL